MNRRANHDLVCISCEIIAETERAFRVYDGAKRVWLPKSQCEYDEANRMMTIPEWLAMEKELI